MGNGHQRLTARKDGQTLACIMSVRHRQTSAIWCTSPGLCEPGVLFENYLTESQYIVTLSAKNMLHEYTKRYFLMYICGMSRLLSLLYRKYPYLTSLGVRVAMFLIAWFASEQSPIWRLGFILLWMIISQPIFFGWSVYEEMSKAVDQGHPNLDWCAGEREVNHAVKMYRCALIVGPPSHWSYWQKRAFWDKVNGLDEQLSNYDTRRNTTGGSSTGEEVCADTQEEKH